MTFAPSEMGVSVLIFADVLFGLLVPTETAEAKQWFWYMFAYTHAFIILVLVLFNSEAPGAILPLCFFLSLPIVFIIRWVDMNPVWKAAAPWIALVGPPTLVFALQPPVRLIISLVKWIRK